MKTSMENLESTLIIQKSQLSLQCFELKGICGLKII